jgi:N-glycosylase/DNA lyase
MVKIAYNCEYFNVKDTLECGQFFRFKPFKAGYLVCSLDKCCYVYQEGEFTYIECEKKDEQYFYNFFDLDRDYKAIVNSAIAEQVEILTQSALFGKGIRILNQNYIEALFWFIISQNNNITRIKGIIERLCSALGEQNQFMGETYYAFPDIEKMAEQPLSFYKELGLGYRAEYIMRLAEDIKLGFDFSLLTTLTTNEIKETLMGIHGVGRKVCDCVTLFGYHRSDSFPVDTWIEKVYKQDFNGTLNDRQKITEWFLSRFKENSGYYQQYLFHYKRTIKK